MMAEKRTHVKVRPEGKVTSVNIREESITFMQGDDELTIQFDSNVNLQNFLNILVLAMHQKFKKAQETSEYGRSSFTYDYEVLNNADLIATLREVVREGDQALIRD